MPLAYYSYQVKIFLSSPLTWGFFCAGLCLGSFLNVCIYRLPRNEFWRSHRSYCPECHSLIPWYLNIPVLSFLLLLGKAACCKAPIPWRYPLVEISSGVLAGALLWKFPWLLWEEGHWRYFPADGLRYGHNLLFLSALLVGSVIDWQYKIIPDAITLGLIALSPLVVYLHPDLTWYSSLGGTLAGGGLIYAIAWIYYLMRRGYGIGMGDAKLLAGIGAWLGYQALFTTLFYGSLSGSIFGLALMLREGKLSLKTEVPFGPFLAAGALVHMFLR